MNDPISHQISTAAKKFAIISGSLIGKACQNARIANQRNCSAIFPSGSHALPYFALHLACENSNEQFDERMAHANTGLKATAYRKEFAKYKTLVQQNDNEENDSFDALEDLRALASKHGCSMIIDDSHDILASLHRNGTEMSQIIVAAVFQIVAECAGYKFSAKRVWSGSQRLEPLTDKIKQKYGVKLLELTEKYQQIILAGVNTPKSAKRKASTTTTIDPSSDQTPTRIGGTPVSKLPLTSTSISNSPSKTDRSVQSIQISPTAVAKKDKHAEIGIARPWSGMNSMIQHGDIKKTKKYMRYKTWLEGMEAKLQVAKTYKCPS